MALYQCEGKFKKYRRVFVFRFPCCKNISFFTNRLSHVQIINIIVLQEDIVSDRTWLSMTTKENQGQWPVEIGMNGSEILNKIKVDRAIEYNEIGDLSITGNPVSPPKASTIKPKPISPEDYLIKLTTDEEVFEPRLEALCLTQGITLVKGFAQKAGLNLGFFSSKTVAKINPGQRIDVRTQVKQNASSDWSSVSQRGTGTIHDYFEYQKAASVTSQTDDTIKFGINIDLSDANTWAKQLKELTQKLPEFLRVDKGMLSYNDYDVLGMNTVQLYMKVTGCRTTGHQENLSVCSVNINVGPGNCEWSANWGVVYNLCERKGLNFLKAAWWPLQKDLEDEGVPVYRFIQGPGDLVFVGFNCVHWVEPLGICNNIAWNVGPISNQQYKLALERYEWNKTQNFESLIPMLDLTVKLSQKVKISDPRLFKRIKKNLLRILVHHVKTQEFLVGKYVEITRDERTENHLPSRCHVCRAEIFGLILIRDPCPSDPNVPLIPYCLPCAVKKSPWLDGFDCREQYTLTELVDIYDGSTLDTEDVLPRLVKESKPSFSRGVQQE